MGMTIAEKIIATAAGVDYVKPGDIHTVTLDRMMSNDGTTHLTVDMYRNKLKHPHIADTKKMVFIVDHNVPSDCPKTAASQKKMRDFAKENNIAFWEPTIGAEFASDKEWLDQPYRVAVKLHPLTIEQNAITSFKSRTTLVPCRANTMGPKLMFSADYAIGGADGALSMFFGTVGLNVTDDALKALADSLDGLLTWQQASSDRSLRYLLVMCHGSVKERALSALRDLGFSTVSFRGMTGTAKENDKALAENLAALEKERQEIEQRIAGLGGKWEALLEASDRAAILLRREEAKSRLVGTDKVFLLEGWLPADRCAALEKALKPFTCAIETREPTEDEYPQVPVQLKNNKLTRPLNMVTEMYSLPAYGTLDPNPLMAPFFILFYGIMMADMGYGLLMMIASVIINKKYRPKGTSGELFSLLGLCGVSTFIMGALTGGFFGDFLTQLVAIVSPGTVFALPKLFDPLDDLTMILIGSMALGMVQIVTGMAISLIEKCKRKKFLDAFFEEITWWLVFLGIALAVLKKGTAVLYLGCALVLLGPIVQGKGWGKLTGVFGSVYNHVTGYFGDILSYTRLMALMLAGSVIAQVFNMLAAMPGNVVAFVIISMLGNAMNFGLNLLGCYVHDLRLQCLEFFNKFYVDGGKPFRPMTLDTEYVDLQ